MTENLNRLIARAEAVLERIEQALPAAAPAPDWSAPALRWRHAPGPGPGRLEAAPRLHAPQLDDLFGIEPQKRLLLRNTEQFLGGAPANNVLLWGSRGTGKSSLVKALLGRYAPRGLRLVEVDKHQLVELPDILRWLEPRPERFVVYCDDLSFEDGDGAYKALKVALEGSVASPGENVLVYATSNRRHLLPEYRHENEATRLHGTELHHGEAVEEKISLSERFGLWIAFHPFTQDEYLHIVGHWLRRFGIAEARHDEARAAALRWALERGSRSGRSAWQFAKDYAGAEQLGGTSG